VLTYSNARCGETAACRQLVCAKHTGARTTPALAPALTLRSASRYATGTQLTKVLKDAKKGAKMGMFSMREKFKKFIGSETELG
jgi:hypothetical protein